MLQKEQVSPHRLSRRAMHPRGFEDRTKVVNCSSSSSRREAESEVRASGLQLRALECDARLPSDWAEFGDQAT
jgi:hypothetical protein